MKAKVLILFPFLISKVFCENCQFAPTCPDLISYKKGFICDQDYSPVIKTRLIDGKKIKTICCKANSCTSNSWCSEKSNIVNSLSAKDSAECSENCRSSWTRYTPKSFLASKALNAGSFAPGISTYIGRTFRNGTMQIGRFQNVHPIGLYFPLDGEKNFENNSIEILSIDNFSWKNSSHGKFEANAVSIDNLNPHQLPFYIARYAVNGQTHVGMVVRVLGLMYYLDGYGIERSSDCYEVLICSTYAPVYHLENESTNQELTSVSTFLSTSTTRKRKSRTTRSRPTRSTSLKTKKTTTTSSNDWLFSTNTETSTSSANNEAIPTTSSNDWLFLTNTETSTSSANNGAIPCIVS